MSYARGVARRALREEHLQMARGRADRGTLEAGVRWGQAGTEAAGRCRPGRPRCTETSEKKGVL